MPSKTERGHRAVTLVSVTAPDIDVTPDDTNVTVLPEPVPAKHTRHTGMVQAAQRRASSTRDRITAAIERLSAAGEAVNVSAVAREANCSRETVYAHQDLFASVADLRDQSLSAAGNRRAAATRATSASVDARLRNANAEIDRLKADNARLRAELGAARQAIADRLGDAF